MHPSSVGEAVNFLCSGARGKWKGKGGNRVNQETSMNGSVRELERFVVRVADDPK
jgi:hypothetical protein